MSMFEPGEQTRCKHPPCKCEVEFGDVYCSVECRGALANDECPCGHRHCRNEDSDFSSVRSRELVSV